MSYIYEALCKCPQVPCPLHETPNRPFDKLAEATAKDFHAAWLAATAKDSGEKK